MQWKINPMVVAGLLVLAFLTACGSGKGCDCPTFGQAQTQQSNAVHAG